MMVIITLFVILIFLLLVGFGVFGYVAWKKVEVFLTWNTRYEQTAYEQAVTATGKPPRPSLPASKTEFNGRKIKQVDDLVDITELPFEDGYKAVAEMGE